jgi:hypothetical protein
MNRLSSVLVFVFAAPLAASVACSSSSDGGGSSSGAAPDADAGSDAPSGNAATQCSAAYKDFLLPKDTVSSGEVAVVDTSGDVKTVYVQASAGGIPNAPKSPRVYVSLATASKVEVSDTGALASTDWDLAFKRDVIFTNSGDGGPGEGGATSIKKAFDAVTAADADSADVTTESFFDADCERKQDPTGGPLTTFSDWYDYDDVTHIPSPKTNQTYVVVGATGARYKVAIESYDATKTGASGGTYGDYLIRVAPLASQ